MPASKERSKKKGAYAFKEGELDRDSVYAKNAYTASDGKIYREGMKRRRPLSFNDFSRKERKGRKEIENQRLRPTIFPEKPLLLV